VPFEPRYVVQGLPGHPLHPPLTDATIGTYTVASVLAVVDATGLSDTTAADAWWLCLVVGLILTVPTAVTGLVDWLRLTWGSELWRTATAHMAAMLTATLFFLLATIFGHDDWRAGNVPAGELVLTLVGFALLTAGGWLGGTIVFVHGMRVLNLVKEPLGRAAAPLPHPEQEMAEEG
jgi:uncharacterized membrane protein